MTPIGPVQSPLCEEIEQSVKELRRLLPDQSLSRFCVRQPMKGRETALTDQTVALD